MAIPAIRRMAVYARLSQDRDGTQTATARQIADARKLAELRGWEVTRTYEDVDLSAYRRGVVRPEYERLLEDIADREVDGVIVWKLDRLVRRAAEFERFWRVCEDAGAILASVNEPVDTSTDIGMVVVRVLVAFAQLEGATMSLRIRRAAQEAAERGEPTLGGYRPFGLTKDRKAIVPEEAELVREAARRVLAGESLRGIVREWHRRGITGTTGKAFSTTTLRYLLIAGRIAGYRDHHRVMVGAGAYPAIVDRDTEDRLRAILLDPGRQKYNPGTARRYLLVGLVRCATCGYAMVARPRDDGMRRYICRGGADPNACGRTFIVADPLEGLVTEMALAALESGELEAQIRARAVEADLEPDLDVLRTDEAALETLSRDFYVDRVISRPEYLAAREALQARIEDARRSMVRRSATAAIGLAGGTARERWPALTFDQRRAVLQALFAEIRIGPGRRGYNRFDAGRVHPVWRA